MSLFSAQADHPLRYELLGRLRVTRGGVDLTPDAPKLTKLLTLLLVRAGEAVPGEKLVAELWEQGPPRCAFASLRVYVSQLRKILCGPRGTSPIVTTSSGYILDLSEAMTDFQEFEELYTRGRERYSAADFRPAGELLRRALSLWRGPVLEGVPSSLAIESFRAVQEEKRLNCTELAVDAALAVGRHHEVIEELKGLLVQHPLREPFYRQLMAALYRAGRQGDALGVYHHARRVLREELGVEPGPPLRLALEAILRADPSRLEATGVIPAAR
ncbi:AfsR/SARP family transcriptional regulator [Streptomyces sp. PSKA30]|uniref:AfsR/SARP family transcriptional regulator n=1 Tax=Streptomyces sp. PSKA30 TaxID=2874597 RepID=UPI001CD04924|nr:AfsR/SARP family transcriptional regulator [Streptomyces sp. PSKA30]MBZ9638668.1 AfsR/SARP family transcriptional regulator [Streptomyces sp. PSKA30]